ncbi:MAG: hypothetical protein EPO27_15180 [Betaproteobacteria bacterium]|nr:MAG: hypothetical protein EPO27_15180 [Betaproteobacteria bacterium]
MPPAEPYTPRSLALVEGLMQRLKLRSTPAFGYGAALGAFAVAGGLLLPDVFGTLAGNLLAMQFLVLLFIVFLLGIVFVRRISFARKAPQALLEARKLTAWIIDFEVVFFLFGAALVGGFLGPLEFIALTGATFLGALRGEHGARELAEVGLRCGLAFMVLLAVSGASELPHRVNDWPGARGSVLAAGLYFGFLAIVETTPFYTWTVARALGATARLRQRLKPPSLP